MLIRSFFVVLFAASAAFAQQPAQSAGQASVPSSAPVSLTIYNENFAVARTTIALDLHPGVNEVTTNEVTTQLEPDSVVLRDPALPKAQAKPAFRIVEQDYDAGVVTQDWLLQKYEGKTIDFLLGNYPIENGKAVPAPVIQGKIIRAPQSYSSYNQYGSYTSTQTQPLVEVNGKMQFSMPGTPLFPASTDGLLLKPTLSWQLESEKAIKLTAELAYVTGGLNWTATYNVVNSGSGDSDGSSAAAASGADEKAELDGWVTIVNRTGAEFPQARIKLIAGDVAKIAPTGYAGGVGRNVMAQSVAVAPQVTQQAFDDYHLYDLNRTVTLRNNETKQIQFLEAPGVTIARSYVYDGAALDLQQYYGSNFNQQQTYGLNSSNTKVQIVQQFKNSEANRLGIPLPAGRMRLYRRDADGAMEFVGESTIGHTPIDDTIKIVSGNAFDVKGSRRQIDFHIDTSRRTLDETFEIKLANQKKSPVTVLVNERLYRGDNWEIAKNSVDFHKLDSHTVQFPVQVPAQADATLTYAVHYTW